MTVVLRTLNENLSEKSDALQPTTEPSSESVSNKVSQGSGTTVPAIGKNSLLNLFVFFVCVHFLLKNKDAERTQETGHGDVSILSD